MKDSNLELRNRNKGEELKSMSKTILITGASSGFGRDTAETLFRAGHTVYASMRGTQGKNREASDSTPRSVSTCSPVIRSGQWVRVVGGWSEFQGGASKTPVPFDTGF